MSNVQSHQEKVQFGQIYHLHQDFASICLADKPCIAKYSILYDYATNYDDENVKLR